MWWNDSGGYHMQRMSSCKDERHSVLATLFFAVFQTSRAWLWIGVGLVSIVLFPELGHTQYGDTQAYPMVMNTYLFPGLKGILVTAFLAAYMSTIDTHLNWGASYLMTDVYRRFIKKEATEKHYMLVTKAVVIVMMVCAAALVPLMKSVTAAWEFLALLLAGGGIIAFLRWFWWRISAYTEITALATAAILSIGNMLLTSFAPEFEMFGIPWGEMRFELKVTMFIAIVIPVSFLVTFLTPPVATDKLEEFYRRCRPGGAWGVINPEVKNLPGKVLSARTILDFFGGLMLTFGVSLGIGYTLFQNYAVAACCFGAAVAGGTWVYHWFQREVQYMQKADDA